MNMGNAPPSGRRATLLRALDMLPASPVIVEVGTTRNLKPHAMIDDGWATRLFAWYAKESGGHLTTIDTSAEAIRAARKLSADYAGAVTFVQGDAVQSLASFDTIHLLYMDGPPEPRVNLAIWRAVQCRPHLVLWDDIVTPGAAVPGAPPGKRYKPWPPPGDLPKYAVKGALAIPEMLSAGYREVFAVDRQVLLEAT